MLRNWQLLAAAGWAVMAASLLFRGSLLSAEQADRFTGANGSTATWVALGLAVWNVFRWYQSRVQSRPRAAPRQPLESHRDAAAKYEYNPELDFHRCDDDKA